MRSSPPPVLSLPTKSAAPSFRGGKWCNALKKKRHYLENIIQGAFLLMGLITVGCVLLITVYLVISGIPAIRQIGLIDFLFGDTWAPTASQPRYGILPFILTSIAGTAGAILVGGPIGFFTAVYLAKKAPKGVKEVVGQAGVVSKGFVRGSDHLLRTALPFSAYPHHGHHRFI